MIEDCRANWVTSLYFDETKQQNDRAPFLNMLIQWNLRLWGCQATLPKNFALIYQGNGVVPVLTRGDAQTLDRCLLESRTTAQPEARPSARTCAASSRV